VITIGVDAHKRVHVAVALDDAAENSRNGEGRTASPGGGASLASPETDAVRHFIALGFLTTVMIGMALLVMPALAMRRVQGRSARLVAVVLLALLQGAAAARGLGSLIVNEGHLDSGYWTMTVGGTLGIFVMLIFVGYILWNPKEPPRDRVPVTERGR
jgi:hypothetical protein